MDTDPKRNWGADFFHHETREIHEKERKGGWAFGGTPMLVCFSVFSMFSG